MAFYLWRQDRVIGAAGAVAALGIIYASTSSGPVLMLAFSVAALMLWPLRAHLAALRWAGAAAIVAL